MVRRDGKGVWLGSSKAFSLTIQRKKPAKLVWTQAWRRLHKKGLNETTTKKRSRRTWKVQRAVVGASLEEIQKKSAQKKEIRTAQEAALKELKDKKAAAAAKSAASSSKGKGSSGGIQGNKKPPQAFQKVPKHMGGKPGRRGGTQR
jgi:large subunit ribosomal protein L24e